MKTAAAFTAITGLLSASVAATPAVTVTTRASKITPVTIKGNAFFAGDKRFYIRGVDYQPGGASDAKDPIADAAGCKRDIAKFKELGVNTIRVYTVDNTADHEECMTALAEAGIYLALDVNTPKYSINRAEPQMSYNKVYLQSIFATIDKFQKYDNTLLFFSGNEVINDDKTTNCAPFVKATTRDMKSYINSQGYRKIPVGYSAADVDSNRFEMAEYMNCGEDSVRSDFFGFNDYSWCDPSDFKTSGWDQKVKKFQDYGIALFYSLSEYGCNTNKREFNEVKSLYSTDMTGVYSGGIVYEYSEEGSKYGLVKIDGDSVTEKDDFTALKKAFAGTQSPSGDGGYKSEGKASKCPAKSKTWDIGMDDDKLPALPEGAQAFMGKEGAGKGPGLTGSGSQTSGSKTTDLAPAGEGAVTSAASGAGKSSTGSPGAAASVHVGDSLMAPMVCGLVVVVSTLFGASLI
ncbi:glycoside hydrolase family 72 protein [Aaosphaeria arxii CBS 175.79]|uniref:1,3-beta-glucanosyltransferase n=1 Tax=Aaosphaeria arxii CBS 175.79 TaxID=1450172 RepID=A0A6A5XPB0_9PLEO|nr:glycoside hydrolase family 72 protein [Aaosphaeria arxii CBS 175.79]KAF2014982.1 glycoside hydrolase family 72 protein [Aaosphaeria arxii CBS 175.79]